MQQTSNTCYRVINADTEATSQCVCDQPGVRVCGDPHRSDTDDLHSLYSRTHALFAVCGRLHIAEPVCHCGQALRVAYEEIAAWPE